MDSDFIGNIAKSICTVECYVDDEKKITTGFLVKFSIPDSDNPIRGLLTTNDISDDNSIYDSKIYLYFALDEKTINLNPQEYFCFSDPFLNIIFIELKNTEFDGLKFINVEENDDNLDFGYILKDLKQKNLSKGKILTKWGFKLYHTISVNSELNGSPIISLNNDKIIGIHINKQVKNTENVFYVGINMKAAIQAIRVLHKSYINDKFAFIQKEKGYAQKEIRVLTDSEIDELKQHGLVSTNTPEVFISPGSLFVTPLWFYRTSYAWYWTPLDPSNNNIDRANWIIIYPGCSLKVIGGYFDGAEPAQRNIILIHWLESTGFLYLV